MSEMDAAAKPVEATQQPTVEDKAVEQPEAAESKETTATDDKAAVEDKPAAAEAPMAKDDAGVLKTKAKIDYDNFKNNRKFDPSVREVTDDPDLIRKQVEFYFGDWNFPQDKFMWESCEGSENKPVAIEKIHSFKRMRTFQPYTAVVAALRESQFLDVSGEEGKEHVNRKVPYKPQAASKAKSDAATVYVKGFGDETPNTQFDLESFFTTFGEVKGLKLRRTGENLFKGSVFVTFADEETAKKFLELDPAPKWKEHDLKVMSKHDYCEEKSDLIRQGKLEPSSNSVKKFFEGKDHGGKGKGGRGGRDNRPPRDADNWKKRREQDQKNGFQGGRGGGRGRGGRGRGGRGGRGGREGGRDRDDQRENGAARHSTNDTTPHIQSTAAAADSGAAPATSNGKRARDDDGGAGDGAPAAKKADTKPAATETA